LEAKGVTSTSPDSNAQQRQQQHTEVADDDEERAVATMDGKVQQHNFL
ncbi:hypothetical protein MTO96_051144, partial [Rhipicephalus appendiculatus]